MTRMTLPQTIDDAPQTARPLLEAVKSSMGAVPNLFRLTANSPEVLGGYLEMNGKLTKGALPVATRERIALAVAQENGCDYCLSAHSYIASKMVKLDAAEIAANRAGGSTDPVADAAVRFAVALVRARGHVSDADVSAVRLAGYSEAEILEIVAHVALNTLTNYLNSAFDTPIDFPVVRADVA